MKIQQKFFLILFSFSLVLVTTLTLLMQWSIGNGMIEYVNTKEIETLAPVVNKLADEYKKANDWSRMQGRNPKFRQIINRQLSGSEFLPEHPGQRGPNQRFEQEPPFPPPPQFSDDASRSLRGKPPMRRMPPPDNEAHYVLFDQQNAYVVGNYDPALEYSKTAITVNGATVGYFSVSKRNRLTQGYELDFIQQQRSYLWLIALIVMVLVVLITLPLTRHVVEPVKLIATGMHQLTQGNYLQQIDLPRKDEIGALSRDYNELAVTLAANEAMRKRWLANISHELRTPVAILRGELEAMLDDIRPLTKENIASVNDEALHLAHIIDDLHQLTSADVGGMRYQKQSENLTELLQTNVNKYRSYLADAGINLTLALDDNPVWVYGDKTRLFQLFENMINNCIKYACATELNITLSIDKGIDKGIEARSENSSETPTACIIFEDNGVGVEAKHLPHLFEYLYRVDDSRNRQTGGAGLGLSICRHIVEAHQGDISAKVSSLGGLAIVITLPLATQI